VLINARNKLLVAVPARHDWASLIAYATLPADIDRQLRVTREQAQRAIYTALTRVDAIAKTLPQKMGARDQAQRPPADLEASIAQAEHRVREPLETLTRLHQTQQYGEQDISGLLAAAKKRLAEVYYRASHASVLTVDRQSRLRLEAESELRAAYRYYLNAFENDQNQSWALVQALVLGLTIGNEPAPKERQLARLLLERDEHSQSINARKIAWAKRGLLELELVELLCGQPGGEAALDSGEIVKRAHLHLRGILEYSQLAEYDLRSLRAQLDRYRYFFFQKIQEETSEAFGRAMNTQIDMPEWEQRREHRMNLSERLEPTIMNLITELNAYEGRRA